MGREGWGERDFGWHKDGEIQALRGWIQAGRSRGEKHRTTTTCEARPTPPQAGDHSTSQCVGNHPRELPLARHGIRLIRRFHPACH